MKSIISPGLLIGSLGYAQLTVGGLTGSASDPTFNWVENAFEFDVV